MSNHSHVIYGLFQAGKPRAILYVGSCLEERLPMRLEEHRGGKCATTTKMAAKHRVPLSDLRAHVTRTWEGENPEGRVMRLCRAFGMARWNHPYEFSSDDGRKGGSTSHSPNGALARNAIYGDQRTPENRRKAGLARFAKHGNPATVEGRRKGGRAMLGRKQSPASIVKRMSNIAHAFKNSDLQRKNGKKGGPKSCHLRWHVRRGIVSPNCALCEVAQ